MHTQEAFDLPEQMGVEAITGIGYPDNTNGHVAADPLRHATIQCKTDGLTIPGEMI